MESYSASKKIFEVSVLKNEVIAEGVCKITFSLEEPFSYKPGQYMWVELLDMKGTDPKGSRRAFSILSGDAKEGTTIAMATRISKTVYKQNIATLAAGDKVKIHGPFGSNFILDTEPRDIVMIAGGLSITAFLPNIEYIQKNHIQTKSFLLYLNNSQDTTPFLHELEYFKKGTPSFDYKVSYEYFKIEDIKKVLEEGKSKTWWINGPQAMVDYVFLELTKAGVPRGDMVFENFYPSSAQSLTKKDLETEFLESNVFANAIQNSTNHMVITDTEGIVLFANKSAELTTGYSLDEIVGNTPRLWGGLMSPDFYKGFWEKKRMGLSFKGEIVNRRKNGELYHALISASPIFGKANTVIGYIGTEEDISGIKKIQQEIAAKSFELNTFFDISQDLIGVAHQDGYWKTINSAFQKLLGFSKEEMLQSPFITLIHPEDVEATENEVAKLMKGIETVNFINRFQKKDGSYVTIEWKASPHGESFYVIGRDVTAAKEKESELERLNRAMIDRELKMIELKKKIKDLEMGK